MRAGRYSDSDRLANRFAPWVPLLFVRLSRNRGASVSLRLCVSAFHAAASP